ncbi:MAG: PA14 domain-containing protein [Pirellulales bacterium]
MPLGAPSAKYTHDSLTTFLRDPLQVRASGRMPNMNLNEQDASDVAAYFLRDVKADPNINYAYYEGKWERLPKFDQMKPLASGTSAGYDISVAKANNNFGLRFEGYLHLTKEERCVFRLKCDDGAKLYIDDILIVDYDGIHPAGEKEAKASLKEGVHKVVVEYFDAGGQKELAADVRFAGKQAWQSVATFLTLTPESKPKETDAGFKVDPKLAKEGRRVFENAGCASCHELKVENVKLASTLRAPALARCAAGRRLHDRTGKRSSGRRRGTALCVVAGSTEVAPRRGRLGEGFRRVKAATVYEATRRTHVRRA